MLETTRFIRRHRASLELGWWIGCVAVAVACGVAWGSVPHVEWWDHRPWFASAAPFLVGLTGGWLAMIREPGSSPAPSLVAHAVLGPLVFVPTLMGVAAQVAEGTETMLYAVIFSPFFGGFPLMALFAIGVAAGGFVGEVAQGSGPKKDPEVGGDP